MMLQHQLLNQLIVQNSLFTNITAGIIYIESANKQKLDTPTKVKIINSTFSSINSQYGSLISMNKGGYLEVLSCTFSQITCLEEGAVIYAGFQRTTTIIQNSTFTNNTSVQGGVFNVDSESVIKIYNSVLSYNFGVVSGVIHSNNNGYFEIYGSHIHHNYAVSSSVSQIFDVVTVPLIDSSEFNDNIVINSTSLTSELSGSCIYLCFMSSSLKNYLKLNPNLYNQISTNKLFQLIQGNLIVQNSCKFYNQGSLFDSFISQLTISSTIIYSSIISDYMIKITSSTASISNCSFYGLSSSDDSGLIQASFGTNLTMNGLTYTNSTSSFINSLSSSVNLAGLNIMNISSNSAILSFDGNTNSMMKSSVLTKLTSVNYSPIEILSSMFLTIINITITYIENNPVNIKNSNIILIDNLNVSMCTLEIYVDTSIISTLQNSTFQSMGSNQTRHGGAMHLTNSNTTIINSKFINNTAVYGGAIHYSCLGSKECILNIKDSSFENNKAHEAGGAINYDVYRPNMINTAFYNNSAVYGNNIASYPIKIKEKESSQDQIILNNIGSGISGNISFVFGLYDFDDQVVSLDNVSQIAIRSIVNNTLVSGSTSVKVSKGVATFDNVIFTSFPGKANISFGLTSNAIDLAKAKRQISSNYTLSDILVSFRFCKPGEIQANNVCIACTSGSYSLLWNSTKCENCIVNADCLGQTQISLDKGYWRYSKNSTFVAECPNDLACLGGFVENGDYPVNCDTGYGGLLCSECQIYNDTKYEKLTDFQCSKCPDPVLNALKVIALGALVLFFIAILIIVNVRKLKESQTSILMRIMANYLQIMTATLSYSMKFPTALMSMFFPVQQLGTGSDSLLSFDCFATSTKMTLFAPSTAILKVFMTAILPIILFLLAFIVWLILYWSFPKRFPDIKRNVVVSIITILFLLHPTLTKSALGMFQCIQIDDNISKMRIDMNITCYSGEHIAWCAFISIPMFVVWVFGCPLVALYFLFKNRHHLNNTTIQKYFIVLYQGLKDDRFYWEFVNTLRKVLIVCINVFLSNYALFYKGVLAIILIIILIRIQKVLDPYKLKVNNECELASFNAACITLFGGLLYVSEVTRISFVDIFAFIVILIINVYFILLWVYLFSYSLDRFKYVRKLTEFLKILLRRKDDVVNIDPPQPNSIVTENKRKPIKKLLKKPCKKKEKKRKLKIKEERKDINESDEEIFNTPQGILKPEKSHRKQKKNDTNLVKITKFEVFSNDSSISSERMISSRRILKSKIQDKKNEIKEYLREFEQKKINEPCIRMLLINEESGKSSSNLNLNRSNSLNDFKLS